VNLIWLKRSPTNWISINLTEIKSFEHLKNSLYINNNLVISDKDKILFNGLQEFIKVTRGGKYPLQNAVTRYNALVVTPKITDEDLGIKATRKTTTKSNSEKKQIYQDFGRKR